MTSEEKNEAPRPVEFKEKMEEPPVRNPPILYKPLKPREFFEKHRDEITRRVSNFWPKAPRDLTLEPYLGSFHYYDYGGQYTFMCDLPDGQPTYITVTESFEVEDGDLANDEEERRRRVFFSVS